jgi:hypothetical protein
VTANTADALFRAYFLPLYPADARADLAAARANDANPAGNPAIYAHVDEAAAIFARQAPVLFGPGVGLDYTDASVHRLSAALTRERRDHWAASGAEGTPENELFNVIGHGAAYVGACIVREHGESGAPGARCGRAWFASRRVRAKGSSRSFTGG